MRPIVSTAPPAVVPPRLENLTGEYRYSTVAGVYSFPKATPYLMQYKSREGETLVNASTFIAPETNLTLFVTPRVLEVSTYRYRVTYDIRSGNESAGSIVTTYDFKDDRAPKISAELQRGHREKLTLAWVLFTNDTVAFNDTSTGDFRDRTPPSEIQTPKRRLQVGPDASPQGWRRRTSVDWTDAPQGKAFAGRLAVPGWEGPAILVKFPRGVRLVDPSVSGSSSQNSATDSTIQRKTFEYAGRHWVFWHDGTSIVYASSQVFFANGKDYVEWTGQMAVPATNPEPRFDVAQRDGTVLVGYLSPNLMIAKGVIDRGSSISWSGSFVVDNRQYNPVPPSVAIGTDGYFWVAGEWTHTLSTQPLIDEGVVYIFRSAEAHSTSFALSRSGTVETSWGYNSALRLVPLPYGGLTVILASDGFSYIFTIRYGADGWPPGTWTGREIGLASDMRARDSMSALVEPDGDVRMVYRHSVTSLVSAVLRYSDDAIFFETIAPAGAYPMNPTVALDANGELHAFWWGDQYRIRYSRLLPGTNTWTSPTEPFGSSSVTKRGLTAAVLGNSLISLVWTEGDADPFHVAWGALSAPMGVGSQTGQPWNRQGISPYESYFQQLSEFVSPGNGLLTIRQTDLAVPGRGIDMAISRVFLTPRAFTTAGLPYLWEDYAAANLGKGWSLNFPWLSDQYVHLWDGQVYVLRWAGDTFENHEGVHFLLRRLLPTPFTYTLSTDEGIVYSFDTSRRLVSIEDLDGNTISLHYNGNSIDYIEDTFHTLERRFNFAYDPAGTLRSITAGERTVSYAYQTVGGVTLLESVTDPLGRVTRFEHAAPGTPSLLTSIEYPTGGRTVYVWSPPIPISGDIQSYYVLSQDVQNAAAQSLKSTTFSPTVVNGLVSHVEAVTWEAGVRKGSTILRFDPVSRRMTTILRDEVGQQMRRMDSWFGASGSVEQVDEFPGASSTPTASSRFAYDEWGNLIYSRDPLGHERFASYANTRNQNGFVAPGSLERNEWTASLGLLFYDDFEERDLGDWAINPLGGQVGLDFDTFESLPPTLYIRHDFGATETPTATYAFQSMQDDVVAEATLLAGESDRDHYFQLKSPDDTIRVNLNLRWDNYIYMYTDGGWVYLRSYSPDQWYRITVQASISTNTFKVWIDGTTAPGWVGNMEGTGDVDRISFQVACSGCGLATMYVDKVKVYKRDDIFIGGLSPGQIVQFDDAFGQELVSLRVPAGASMVTLASSPAWNLPYGTLRVLESDGSSPSSAIHEIWGGDDWVYTGPWESAGITRTANGFLSPEEVIWVEDSVPSGSTGADNDIWDWGTYNMPPSATPLYKAHRSKYVTGMHEHYFLDPPPGPAGVTMAQYVYIPDQRYPSEIMLQYCDMNDVFNLWEHRAFWGNNLIDRGTLDTASRRDMGPLPTPSGRWLKLVIRSFGNEGVGLTTDPECVSYVLFGGQATWDRTAASARDGGVITLGGLQTGWHVVLRPADGSAPLWEGDVDPFWGNFVPMNLYDPTCCSPTRAFPIEASIEISDGGTLLYQSPVRTMWGGDEWTYSGGTNFYPNEVATTVHSLPVGTLEFQTGRGESPEVPQESYFEYTESGSLMATKVIDEGGVPRESTFTYGSYGLPIGYEDPLTYEESYWHSSAYLGAYTTQVTVGNPAGWPHAEFGATYDPWSGSILSERDAVHGRVRYEYDLGGRTTAIRAYEEGSPSMQSVLYWDMEATDSQGPLMADLSWTEAHPGTVTGTAWIRGPLGLARSFDGSASVVYPYSSSHLENWHSISGWFRTDLPTADERLVSYGDPRNPVDFDYVHLRLTSVGGAIVVALVSSTSSGSSQQVETDFTPVAGEWFHAAAVVDGFTTLIYINGRVRGTGIAPSVGNAPVGFSVGADSSGPGSNDLRGAADEIRVFESVLTEEAVKELYENGEGLLSSTQVRYDDSMNVVTVYEPTSKVRALHLDMETLLNEKLEDLGGHGLHGTAVGTTLQPGVVGQARDLDGDDYIVVPDHTGLDGVEATTIALWVKHDYTANPCCSKILVYKGPHYQVRNYDIMLHWGLRIQMNWYQSDLSHGEIFSTTVLQEGEWYHVMAVFDWLQDQFSMYINGVLEASTSSTLEPWPNNGNLYLGRIPESPGYWTGPPFFDGRIDEVQVFDRALDESEIVELVSGSERGFYLKQYSDSLGRTTLSMRRDLFGTLVSWESFAYNFRDQVKSHTVARDEVTTFTTLYDYDFLGRVKSVTSPGTTQPVTLAYNDVDRRRTVTAENGRKTEYVYDEAGRQTGVLEHRDGYEWDPYTESWKTFFFTSYVYDEVGNLLSVRNPLGQITRHEYDRLNRLTATIYPDDTPAAPRTETYTYDAIGNLKTRTDRAGDRTDYVYDDLYRLEFVCYNNPDCTEPTADAQFGYDANDNLLYAGARNPTVGVSLTYDASGQVIVENTLLGGRQYQVDYAYDAAGRVTGMTYPFDSDAPGSVRPGVDYLPDPVGRTAAVFDHCPEGQACPIGMTASFTYYADDLLKQAFLGGGPLKEELRYNGRGWPTSIHAALQSIPEITYLDLTYPSYDPSGNILAIGGTKQVPQSFTYDDVDRLETASGGFDYGYQEHHYDALGNRQEAVVLRPDGVTPTTEWDKSGTGGENWDRVGEESIDFDTYVWTQTAGSTDLYSIQNLPPNLPIESVTVVAVASGCDLYCTPGGVSLRLRVNGYASPDLELDEFEKPLSFTWAENPATDDRWTLGEVNALEAGIEAVSASGEFAIGVFQLYVIVHQAIFVYNDGPTGMNELLSVTRDGLTTTYAYDAKGNLGSKTRSDGAWWYEYDFENRMTEAKLNGVRQQGYLYDALGRRVRVEGATSSTWTATIQVGDTVVFERDQSDHTTKYVYAAGLRVARTDCDPGPPPLSLACTTSYYLTDHLGSTRKVLATPDPPNPLTVTFTAEYTPFGEAYNVAGSERFQFTGEQHDDPTGFTHLRARQYDPGTGRFTGADPILGSLSHPQTQNRYAYAVGNPGRYTDPSGTCIWDLCIGETLIVLGLLAVAGIAIAAASQYVPEFRPVADAFATVFGFIPLFGDVYSTAYFLTQDAFECQTGGCDWGAIGLDAVGIIPGIPNLGGGVHAAKALGGIGGMALTVRTANRAGDAARGFESFAAFKRAMGKAGDGFEWHHVVGQTPDNIRHFGATRIHNVDNIVAIPVDIHVRISAYYSRTSLDFTGGRTVRQWLALQSYAKQFDFGWDVLQRAMGRGL